ncbi:G1 family glutamic endopeptidase [Clostridium felsineum]|uniref:G1 family glutamic endopeptidase n=1 Tax=Clostridium felsineum TaxID=36839 RepID=UPI00098CB710|nr:G1 family glutamic endopeptidase [Clostridium felsineum]URZ18624.1 hypothetical protein CLFE_047120 [Clostridium felsineum DSM 794]
MINKHFKVIMSSIIFAMLASSTTFAKQIINSTNGPSLKNKGPVIFNTKKLKTNPIITTKQYTKTYPNTKNTPPSTFNPLTATDTELDKYGFPSRPTDKKQLAQWENAMRHAKKHVSLKIKNSNTTHGTSQSPNWTGYVCQGSSNNNTKFYQSCTEFFIPQYNGSTNDDPAIWTGIGGYNGSYSIVQAGADLNATGSPYSGTTYGGTTQYEFWIEDFPENVSYASGIPIKPGDEVFVNVKYSPTTHQSTAYFENDTTSQYGSVNFDGTYYDGSSADFVCEATGSQYHGNWPSINFVGNMAYYNYNESTGKGDSSYLPLLNYDTINLQSGNYTEAVPSSITSKLGGFMINTY